MQVRLLGPLDVVVDGQPRPVTGRRRKAVLAVLALHPGQIVAADRLIEVVWGADAPPTAANTLQSHMSHLRRLFGSRTAIVARLPGYRLELGADGTDVQVAERLIQQGLQARDDGERIERLGAALALWRGRPLADVGGTRWLEERAERLDQLWQAATRSLVDARLAVGEHAQLVPELERLAAEHPFDEQLHGQLMLALYRSGRQAAALAVYQRLRAVLSEDLGIDPAQTVRDLYAGILRQDGNLTPSGPTALGPPPATSKPSQLPLAVRGFTGRVRELEALDALARDAVQSGRRAVVIAAVTGTAGVGKTALAVYWAHRVAERFPDGQLYVDLRGFDPAGAVLDPADAIRGLLDALGVPQERIPVGLEARASLYRSLLAGKRMLVLLDNARDVEQLRPLLPGSPGCVVLVTSRSHLTPLIATEGAAAVTLDLLSTMEAEEFLAGRLGADRVAAEPAAVAEIVQRCARLPLALAIVAARAATHPEFALAALAAELADTSGGLDGLDGGDPATNVRTVFSWSYRSLGADAARLFRLLGLHPGPEIGAQAAASLAGAGQPVRAPLTELVRAHLLTERTAGRYTFHDLLRAYAAEQAAQHDSADERRAALHRVLDHYLHTANSAARSLYAQRRPVELAPPQPGVAPERVGDAGGWFATEYPTLLAAIECAASAGFDTQAWQLAWAFSSFLLRRGHLDEHLTVQYVALAAARRAGDRLGLALTEQCLALGYSRLGQLDAADDHYQRALHLCVELGDLVGQGHAYVGRAEVAERAGRPDDGLRYTERALELYRRAGDRVWEASALNGLGWSYARLGDHRLGLTYCEQALRLLQDLGDRDSEARTWDSLGYAYRGLAEYGQSAACYARAIELCREIGDRYWEADAYSSLGDTHQAAGDPGAAGTAWRHALDILDEIGHPDAAEVRAKLRS